MPANLPVSPRIATLLLPVLLLAAFGCATNPTPPPVAAPAPVTTAAAPLPIFALPRSDTDHGNGIDCVLVDCSQPGCTTYSVVFRDEDHPLAVADQVYDVYRWIHWKRRADIESFEIRHDPHRFVSAIYFSDTYAGDTDFNHATHREATIALREFEHIGDRPVIYVNTWNHMFSNRNNQPDAPMLFVSDYKLRTGNRTEAERLLRGTWAR